MRNWPISARIKVKSRYQSNDVAMGCITVTPGSIGYSLPKDLFNSDIGPPWQAGI
jgi:hypothetical protein